MGAETGKKLILVIDDEPDVVTYLATLFNNNGYATESATNGIESIDKIKEEKPDLITLDISMPEKSGIKFYREIKENPEWADIPVLVITGVTGYGGEAESFERFLSTRKQIPPPEGFIAKPLEDREDLLAKIKELIE